MRLMIPMVKRATGDSRFTLLRFETTNYIYGRGWKVSVSLHRKFFYLVRKYRQLRITLLGINVHWRGA